MILNQLFLSLLQVTFSVRCAAVFHFFNGTYNNWYKRICVAYFPTCKCLSSFFDSCLQVDASSTWMPKWTQGPGQLLREVSCISSSYEKLSHVAWSSSYLTWCQAFIKCEEFNSFEIQDSPHMENYLCFSHVSFFYFLIFWGC